MHEAPGGFSAEVVKKVAKDILSALTILHDCEMVHTDIKPSNIAASVSQSNLLNYFDEVVKGDDTLKNLRMSVKQGRSINVVAKKKKFNGWLKNIPTSQHGSGENLHFKLIDFGNSMVSPQKYPFLLINFIS